MDYLIYGSKILESVFLTATGIILCGKSNEKSLFSNSQVRFSLVNLLRAIDKVHPFRKTLAARRFYSFIVKM